MRIITISREFGSGGRALGKCIADILGFDYYDKEIIARIADEEGLNGILVNHEWRNVPVTFRNSFASEAYQGRDVSILGTEKLVIEEIGKSGNDCVIVGRSSDVYLREYAPFNVFVCADMASRIARCRKNGDSGEMSDREIEKEILRIDRKRAALHDTASDTTWGERSAYHLTVNSAGWETADLAQAVAGFALKWFGKQ